MKAKIKKILENVVLCFGFLFIVLLLLVAVDSFFSWVCPCLNYCTGCWPGSVCSYAGIYGLVIFIILVLAIVISIKKYEAKT